MGISFKQDVAGGWGPLSLGACGVVWEPISRPPWRICLKCRISDLISDQLDRKMDLNSPPPPAVRAPQWLTCTLKSEKRHGMTSIHRVSGLGFYFIRTKWWKQWKWRCVSKGRRERQMDIPIKVGGRWFLKVVKGVPDLWPQEQTLKWMGTPSTPSKYQLVQRAQTVCSSGLTFDFLLFGTFSCKARRWHKTSSISLKSPTLDAQKNNRRGGSGREDSYNIQIFV